MIVGIIVGLIYAYSRGEMSRRDIGDWLPPAPNFLKGVRKRNVNSGEDLYRRAAAAGRVGHKRATFAPDHERTRAAVRHLLRFCAGPEPPG